MEVSFSTPLAEQKPVDAPVAPAPVSMAIVPAPQRSLSPALQQRFAAQFDGEFDGDDIGKAPIILVAKSAKTAVTKIAPPGSFLLNGEINLGPSLKVVFLPGIRKSYEEDLSDAQRKAQPDRIPARFETIAAARALGYDLKNEKGSKKIIKKAVCSIYVVVPIVHPAAELADFSVEGSDGQIWGYVRGQITVKKGGYRAVVNVLTRDCLGWLKGRLIAGYYVLTAREQTYQNLEWFEPKIVAAGKVPVEIQAQIAEATPDLQGTLAPEAAD